MSLWQRFIDALWKDASIIRAEDAAEAEKFKSARPGEEPEILTSPQSLLQLISGLSLVYGGGSIFLFDLNIWWGIAIAFVGLVVFFDWCNRYPLRIWLSGQGDIVKKMRLRDKYSKDQAAEIIKARLASDYRRLGFARVLRPNHPIRYVELLLTPRDLILLPVSWESTGVKSYKLFRHDCLRWFTLRDCDLQVYAPDDFHLMHPRLRPRHHPNYLPFFFVLAVRDEKDAYRLVLQFEVGTLPDKVCALINEAQPTAPAPRQPDNEGRAVMQAWHVPAPSRARQSG